MHLYLFSPAFVLLFTCFIFVNVPQTVVAWRNKVEDDALFEKYIPGANSTYPRDLNGNGGNILHIQVAIVFLKMNFTEPNQITLNMGLFQQWNDDRLMFNAEESGTNYIHLSTKSSRRVWLPSTYFELASETVHQGDSFKEETKFNSTGHFCMSQLLVVKLACTEDYSLYPVDQQRCTLLLRSKELSDLIQYQIVAEDVWSSLRDGNRNPIYMPDMTLNGFTRRLDRYNYTHNSIEVAISRKFFFYLTRFYLPAFFVVVASFLPMYLSLNAHCKVGLGVVVSFIMVLFLIGNFPPLPKINYLTLMDVYLSFCFLSIILALAEYVAISYLNHNTVKNKEKSAEEGSSQIGSNIGSSKGLESFNTKSKGSDCFNTKKEGKTIKWATVIHFISQKLYPFFFVLFHLLYSAVLLYIVFIRHNNDVEIKHPTKGFDDFC